MSTTTSTPPPVADPRPRATVGETVVTPTGWRCTACRHPLTQPALRCPLCRGALTETTFEHTGTVFASTCLRVRVPGHTPPFAVAYLVLDGDGPRVLVHTEGDEPLPPGTRAEVAALDAAGNLVATPLATEVDR